MGIWDRFGRSAGMPHDAAPPAADADEQAILRYRYLLKTAPPETIEQAHAEAFAALTPEQRRKVLQRLSEEMPEAERRAFATAADSPGALAQAATRAEIRQPGAIERAFGGPPAAAPGFGSMLGGSLLGSLAGTVLGGMVAQHFFGTHPEASHLFDSVHDAPAHADTSSTENHDAFDADAFDNGGDFTSDSGGGSWDV